jgi:hypothetical protein
MWYLISAILVKFIESGSVSLSLFDAVISPVLNEISQMLDCKIHAIKQVILLLDLSSQNAVSIVPAPPQEPVHRESALPSEFTD